MLRANGEIAPVNGDAPLTSHEIEAMLHAVMLPQNREEFAEINDTDFAHEMPGGGPVSRQRSARAQRDRRGIPRDSRGGRDRRADGHLPRKCSGSA